MNGRIEEIEVFVQVMESGSFSSAASILHLTPSGVSKLIRRVENRLGAQLFYRNSRSILPTTDGEVFYQHCKIVIDSLETAEASVSKLRSPSGTLRVNTMPSFAKYQLARIMPEFQSRFPNINVEFILGAMPIDLLKQRIDISVYSGALPDSTLIARPLAASRWVLAASPSYLKRHGVPKAPSDLLEHKCLHFAFPTPWNSWHFHGDSPTTVEIHGSLGSDQGDMLLELALAGTGIVRLAQFHISDKLRTGELVPLLSEYSDTRAEPLYLVYPARENLSPRVSVWMDFLQEKFGGTPPWEC